MELNSYQRLVMEDLSSYLSAVNRTNNIIDAWREFWNEKDIAIGSNGVPAYKNRLPQVPHICVKVPTGGGKTFLAACSIQKIFSEFPANMNKTVIWLVPSDSILTQTVQNLSSSNHPYRVRLDRDFSGRVGIYTKDMLLNGEEFSPDTVQEMLTICVMSYASLRIDSKKKDVRKVYQENGNLRRFAEFFKDSEILLADTPDTALIQVLRNLSPVVIVDESHNAGSKLSTEMLSNLNPSFVLEFTATPRENSNIISYVDARALKNENMVKLPVMVFSRADRQTVMTNSIQLRNNLEKLADDAEKNGGSYIRPIVLFQAQPNINEDSETFEKIRDKLMSIGIPSNQIAIKTSKIDDLKNVDLLSRDCPIRYIITVNALKEGWDCPFAYILASLANRSSKVDVEQILGRILRQPYVKKHSTSLLNISYVLTSSADFRSALDNIVAGLNQAGFTRKDCRVAEEMLQTSLPIIETSVETSSEELARDDFEDIQIETAKSILADNENSNLDDMVQEINASIEEYKIETNESYSGELLPADLSEKVSSYSMQEKFRDIAKNLKIPQFFRRVMNGDPTLLKPEHLSEGFRLRGQDAQINFELTANDVYSVDISADGEAVPKYKRASQLESEFFRKQLETVPTDKKIHKCAELISEQINKIDRYATQDIYEYVERIIGNMSEDELAHLEFSSSIYAYKIKEKIESLENIHRENQFRMWIDSGQITCQPWYEFPENIIASDSIDSIPLSLYESEKNDMNRFEREFIDELVNLPTIEFWHRNIERKGFCLNGVFNHYPDFICMTKSGKIILIEAKGDYLDGDDSRKKLALGRNWQKLAGENYRYFMVFKSKDLGLDGAYTLENFIELMKNI